MIQLINFTVIALSTSQKQTIFSLNAFLNVWNIRVSQSKVRKEVMQVYFAYAISVRFSSVLPFPSEICKHVGHLHNLAAVLGGEAGVRGGGGRT